MHYFCWQKLCHLKASHLYDLGKFGDAKWLYERSGDAGFIQSIWVMAHFHQSRGEYLKNCFDLKLIADSSPSVAKYIHLGFKLLSETNYSGSLMCFLIASYQGSLIGQLNSAYLCKLVRSNKIKLDKINLETLEFYLLLQALMQGSNYALYSIANIFNERYAIFTNLCIKYIILLC